MNDNKLRSGLQIVSEYRRAIMEGRTVVSEQTFIQDVTNAKSDSEKVEVISTFFLYKIESNNALYHIMLKFSSNKNFLSDVYNEYLKQPLQNPLSYVKNIKLKYQ